MDIGTFWVGESLGKLEMTCLKSMTAAGHSVVLYSYESIAELPAGIERRDANEILPVVRANVYLEAKKYAQLADIFRYRMIASTGLAWLDTDVVLLKSLPQTEWIWARETRKKVGNAVLYLPPESKTLLSLIKLTDQDEITLPTNWRYHLVGGASADQRQAALLAMSGVAQKIIDLPYATIGPHALTYFALIHEEFGKTMGNHTFYPFPHSRIVANTLRPMKHPLKLDEEVVGVHLYGGPLRKAMRESGQSEFRRHSLIGAMKRKFG
ncbi:glycosyltransferase family 32 protein [Celeribacter litoreus]|uniref:hypothetical protein n=1 Tax=Celeribacter litoreus TaxID=2876714 RepID=UPI001CCA6B6D|nr:hypothetical protein [Celeribacter litoreus]MCA0043437.1 hypothetical protein [Celeribacter litoreus]